MGRPHPRRARTSDGPCFPDRQPAPVHRWRKRTRGRGRKRAPAFRAARRKISRALAAPGDGLGRCHRRSDLSGCPVCGDRSRQRRAHPSADCGGLTGARQRRHRSTSASSPKRVGRPPHRLHRFASCGAAGPANHLKRTRPMIGALGRSLQRLNRWPVLLLGLAALFWAGNTVAARLAIDEISPLTLTALRWVMVAAALWPAYGREVRRHWPQIRPRLGLVVLLALLGMTGFNALYYVAAHYTSAINIGILQGAMPIFVLAGAY